MEARYGLKKNAKRQRRAAIVLGGTLMALLLAWIGWAAFGQPATASGTVSGFGAESNLSATMQVTITKPTDSVAICQVSAQNAAGGTVGSKQVRVGKNGTTSFNIRITTVEPAVGAAVELCALK